jgi:biopolymer transport protein ExbD
MPLFCEDQLTPLTDSERDTNTPSWFLQNYPHFERIQVNNNINFSLKYQTIIFLRADGRFRYNDIAYILDGKKYRAYLSISQ